MGGGEKMKKIFIIFLILPMFLGCATAEKWVQKHPTTVVGIGAGALTGGLVGGIIGHQLGSTAGGMLIGSAVGGTTGGLWGNSLEKAKSSSKSSQGSVYNSSVAETQKKLNLLGYDSGPIDGILGPKSRKAIREFQEDNRLKANGNLDKPTIIKIKQVVNEKEGKTGLKL
jgi:hypothetical protein